MSCSRANQTRLRLAACLLTLIGLAATPILAQQSTTGMSGMSKSDSPADQAFEAADHKMMSAMKQPLTGDADRDFVAKMIPHHQGAIDMAKVELEYCKDPQLRKLAQDIIKAQEKEIAIMKQWQAKHAH
jgi:uncharacterized protein (DUF305 family)